MTIHRGMGLDHKVLNTSSIIIYYLTNCSGSRDNDTEDMESTFTEVTTYIDLVIHFLGMLGNLLSIIILSRHRICGKKMNHLLLGLTVAEVAYTGLSFFSEVLEHVRVNRRSGFVYIELLARICVHAFLSQRNWWVVVIGAIRYLVISRPFKMKECSYYHRTGLNVLFLIFLGAWILESIILTLTFRVLVHTCIDTGESSTLVWALHKSSFLFRLMEGLVVFIRTVFPCFLVSTFSSLTLAKLYKGNSIRRQRLSSATRTILLLTLAFVLLELPYGLTLVFCFIDTSPETFAAQVYTYYSRVSQILVALDSLCNTIIYCVSSPSYRGALSALLCCHDLRTIQDPISCRRHKDDDKYDQPFLEANNGSIVMVTLKLGQKSSTGDDEDSCSCD